MKLPKPRKLPSGSWFIRLRIGGQDIGVTRPTERDCINAARLIKAEYLAGKKIEQKQEKNSTLGQAIDRYIESRENILSPSTIRGYKTIQRTRFLPYMNKTADSIPYQQMCNEEAKLCSAKTLTNAWRFVASALRYSNIEYPTVSLPQIVQSERPFLTPDQIKVFIKAVQGKPCEIPALLALSSLRRSEIASLTWDNVKDKYIQVRGATVLNDDNNLVAKKENKNTSSRRDVPIMIPELKAALDRSRKPDGLVLQGNINSCYKQINTVCAQNNLPLVGVHGLRHSFASLAYHLQIPEQIAMEIGGWSDITTMRKIYTHVAQSDINRYATKMQDFFKNGNENGDI